MKRIVSFAFAMVLLCGMIPFSASAAEAKTETIFFEDGSYLVIEVLVNGSRASGSITGSKPATY